MEFKEVVEKRRAAAHVHVFALIPEHITGKRVHEA